jgi:hypothetical protein
MRCKQGRNAQWRGGVAATQVAARVVSSVQPLALHDAEQSQRRTRTGKLGERSCELAHASSKRTRRANRQNAPVPVCAHIPFHITICTATTNCCSQKRVNTETTRQTCITPLPLSSALQHATVHATRRSATHRPSSHIVMQAGAAIPQTHNKRTVCAAPGSRPRPLLRTEHLRKRVIAPRNGGVSKRGTQTTQCEAAHAGTHTRCPARRSSTRRSDKQSGSVSQTRRCSTATATLRTSVIHTTTSVPYLQSTSRQSQAGKLKARCLTA